MSKITYTPPLFWANACNACQWSFGPTPFGGTYADGNPPMQKVIRWHCTRDGVVYNVTFTLCAACDATNMELHEVRCGDMAEVVAAFKPWP
jgi:hypothetical protein